MIITEILLFEEFILLTEGCFAMEARHYAFNIPSIVSPLIKAEREKSILWSVCKII
jgi:hypothetical protein